MGLRTRRGVLVEEEGSTWVADNGSDSVEARVLRPLQAAACTYRIAFGPRAGQKVLTLQSAMPREKDIKQTLSADIDGFSQSACIAGWRWCPGHAYTSSVSCPRVRGTDGSGLAARDNPQDAPNRPRPPSRTDSSAPGVVFCRVPGCHGE